MQFKRKKQELNRPMTDELKRGYAAVDVYNNAHCYYYLSNADMFKPVFDLIWNG